MLDEALAAFAGPGFNASSLDTIAKAAGVKKQTVLYYFPSKEALLDAVIDRSAGELAETLETALLTAGDGWARVESVVRRVFRLAVRRPELLGFLREVTRLGPPATTRLAEQIDPLVDRAREFLSAEMDRGAIRRHDPRFILVAAYSMVIGISTEAEALRAAGVEPTARSLLTRRNDLLAFLRDALVP